MLIPKRLTIAVDLLMTLKRKPQRVEELAIQLKTTTDFLQQIVRQLRNAGLVEVKRGPGGGVYNINDTVSVETLVNAVSPVIYHGMANDFFGNHITNNLLKGTLDLNNHAVYI